MTDAVEPIAPVPADSDADPDMPEVAPWWAKYLSSKLRCISKEMRLWGALLLALAPEAYQNISQIQAYVTPGWFHLISSIIGGLVTIGIIRNHMKGN